MANKYESALEYTETNQINDMFKEWYGPDERLWLSTQKNVTKEGCIQDMWHEMLSAEGYTGTMNDMLKAYWDAPYKYIPTLSGTQYGTFDTVITFTGDFEVEMEYSTTLTDATPQGLFGYDISGTTHYFQLENGAGLCRFKTDDGIVAWTHNNEHRDGKVHILTAYRSGLTIGIKLDGVIKASLLLATAINVKINLIGCLAIGTVPSQLFNGQNLSTKFIDNGTVVANYVFDSGSDTEQYARGSTTDKITLINFATSDYSKYTLQSNITHDAGSVPLAWVGGNLVTNGTFDIDANWTKVGDWSLSNGTWLHGTADNIETRQENIGVLDGSNYICSYENTTLTAGGTIIKLGGGDSSPVSTEDKITSLLTGGAVDNVQIVPQSGHLGSVDNVSAKHLLEVV